MKTPRRPGRARLKSMWSCQRPARQWTSCRVGGGRVCSPGKSIRRPQAYHGSVVRYQKGTCDQIRAITTLFKEKNRAKYVGLRLWRLGFPVDEKYWRPRLQKSGRQLDWIVPLVIRLIDRFNRDSESETFYDRAARGFVKTDDIVLSRLKGPTRRRQLADPSSCSSARLALVPLKTLKRHAAVMKMATYRDPPTRR